jgi:hypothetical protein
LLIVDKATTFSQKSTLILYICVLISGCEMSAQVNLFIDSTELDDVTATGIFYSLDLPPSVFRHDRRILNNYLVSVTCDGAVVIFGSRCGFKKLL